MLREIAGLAAERRTEEQAAELARLADAFAAAPDAAAAAAVDFALVTEMAHAAGNLVFVLILNAIRDLYLAHADRLPVTRGARRAGAGLRAPGRRRAGPRRGRGPRRPGPSRASTPPGGAVVTAAERRAFARFADTVVAPAPPLPPVWGRPTRVPAFAALLAASPAPNRAALRLLVLGSACAWRTPTAHALGRARADRAHAGRGARSRRCARSRTSLLRRSRRAAAARPRRRRRRGPRPRGARRRQRRAARRPRGRPRHERRARPAARAAARRRRDRRHPHLDVDVCVIGSGAAARRSPRRPPRAGSRSPCSRRARSTRPTSSPPARGR